VPFCGHSSWTGSDAGRDGLVGPGGGGDAGGRGRRRAPRRGVPPPARTDPRPDRRVVRGRQPRPPRDQAPRPPPRPRPAGVPRLLLRPQVRPRRGRRVGPPHRRPLRPGDVLLARDGAGSGARGRDRSRTRRRRPRPGARLVRRVRHRGGTADPRRRPRRSRLVRPDRGRNSRHRHQPRRAGEGRGRRVPRSLLPRPPAGAAGQVLHPGRRRLARGPRAEGPRPLRPGQPPRPDRHARPRGRAVRLLPQRVHLLLGGDDRPGRGPVRRADAAAGPPVPRRVRVAGAGEDGVRAGRDRGAFVYVLRSAAPGAT